MWRNVEGMSRPVDIDTTTSGAYVYVRRNIAMVVATDDAPAHYRWEEARISRDEWEHYQHDVEVDSALDDVFAALTEVAELAAGGA